MDPIKKHTLASEAIFSRVWSTVNVVYHQEATAVQSKYSRKCYRWSMWQTTSIWCWHEVKRHPGPAHQPQGPIRKPRTCNFMGWHIILFLNCLSSTMCFGYHCAMLVAFLRCLLLFGILVVKSEAVLCMGVFSNIELHYRVASWDKFGRLWCLFL